MYNTSSISIKAQESLISFGDYILKNFFSDSQRNLIIKNKSEILKGTFLRAFKNWLSTNPKSHFSVVNSGKSDICLKTNEIHIEHVSKTYNMNLKNSNRTYKKQVSAKIPNAVITFNAEYEDGILKISLKSIDSKSSEEHIEKYVSQLWKEMEIAKRNIENSNKFNNEKFIFHFLNTLHYYKFSPADGYTALNMLTIYNNILNHFPDFKKLNQSEKIKVLNEGCASKHKDIYCLAHKTFYALLKTNVITTFINYDNNSDKMLKYNMIKAYYDSVFDKESKKSVPNTNHLLFVTYSTKHHNTSFSANVLWNVLTASIEN